MDKRFIPSGLHYGLKVRHPLSLLDAGPFTGGGWKLVWHTTEGGTLDSVVQTLREKGAGVHFVIDPAKREVVQLIPLDRAGRGLEHVFAPETNRANAIQVEIVGFASRSALFNYDALAALAVLIEHRVPVPRTAAPGIGSFLRPRKLGSAFFVRAAGHLGHVHVPGNNHTDPGRLFRGKSLRKRMSKFDKTPVH